MSIEVTWFLLVACGLSVYVVLDGFDLGAGILHLRVARDDAERRACLRSIGPVWDGNEVWLLASGGTLYFVFPPLYARGFSGFYLPLMMTLWLLALRALAIELRHQIPDRRIWKPAWDVIYARASLLLAFVLGAALGNVVRGVPMDADGRFFEPLWTDFRVGEGVGSVGVLDWYTCLVGVTAVATLAVHGALWLADRVGEPVATRAEGIAIRLIPVVAVLDIAVTGASLAVQPLILENLAAHPWAAVFPLAAAGGLIYALLRAVQKRRRAAFMGSVVHILGMMGSAVAFLFPYVLPGRGEHPGLTLFDAAAPAPGLWTGLWWWLPGMALVTVYFYFVYSRLPATCEIEEGDGH